MKQNKEILEDRFDKNFTYGVLLSASSDLTAGKDIRFKREYHPDTIKDFISSELLLQRTNDVREILEIISDIRSTQTTRGDSAIQIVEEKLKNWAKEKGINI